MRIPFAVRESECASPRPARHQPALYAEAFAQALDVRYEVRRRVARQVDVGLARVRGASAAVPLVEQDRPVDLRVEQPTLPRRAARPRTAVQDDSRPPVRVAAHLPVQEVALADVEHAVVVGLDRGIQPGHSLQTGYWSCACWNSASGVSPLARISLSLRR